MTNKHIQDKFNKNKLNGFRPLNNSSVGNEITPTNINFMLIQTLQNRILYISIDVSLNIQSYVMTKYLKLSGKNFKRTEKGVSGVVSEEGMVIGSSNHRATHLTSTKMKQLLLTLQVANPFWLTSSQANQLRFLFLLVTLLQKKLYLQLKQRRLTVLSHMTLMSVQCE